MKLVNRVIIVMVMLAESSIAVAEIPQTSEEAAQVVVVTDPSGALIEGAQINLTSSQGTHLQSWISDSSGSVSISGLKRGSYILEVIASGFQAMNTSIQVPRAVQGVQTVRMAVASSASEITVTTKRGSVEEVDSSLQFVTSIGREHLVQRPLATIANALEGAPGVTVQQTTYVAASPILHGQTGYQTLLLMDGIRFNTSIFRSGPNQYIALMDPSASDRIEVTLGPSGANYGSDSLGGTINVLSQVPRFTPRNGEGRLHGEFNILGSTADLSSEQSARINAGTRRLAILFGAALSRHNDVRAGGGYDSHHVYKRYFDLNREQLRNVFGDRLQNTGFLQYSADTTIAARLALEQTLTFRYLRSDIQNGRSYRDTWGGANRMRSLFVPQDLNFGYIRYEKQGAGFLDWISAATSLNQQSDGSILKGSFITDIETSDRSRVTARGYASQAATHIGARQALAFGGEVYDERILSTRMNFDPVANTRIQDRALYPNNSRYITTGVFLQDSINLIRNRLRGSAGIRYTGVNYTTKAADNLDANGKSLGVIDSARSFNDVTFNTGLQWSVTSYLGLDANVSRGFRAPNVNDLGAVGAKTLGYDVTAEDAIAAGALLGVDSSDAATATGKKIEPLGPETLMNYEFGFRVETSRWYFRSHFFDAEFANPISGRTLLFPVDRIPASIGNVAITALPQSAAQRAQGVTAVVTNLVARSVKTAINEGKTRYFGTDNAFRFRLNSHWNVEAGYSFLGGLDLNPVRPTRRLPPQEASLRVRYSPSGRKPWLEAAVRAAGAQNRMNTGDIDDDRIGASRRRSDIATFFRSYPVAQNISPGPDGRLGTADDLFTVTNETLRQIQDRILPLNTTVNGVLVSGDSVRVPLYTGVPGWASLSLSGGYSLTERSSLMFGVNNMLDRNYRSIGSGVDSPGINAFTGIRYIF